MMNGWSTTTPQPWNRRNSPSTYGYLNARYFNTVAITRVDASARRMSIDQLRDMRVWDNFAAENTNTSGVYQWRPRP